MGLFFHCKNFPVTILSRLMFKYPYLPSGERVPDAGCGGLGGGGPDALVAHDVGGELGLGLCDAGPRGSVQSVNLKKEERSKFWSGHLYLYSPCFSGLLIELNITCTQALSL